MTLTWTRREQLENDQVLLAIQQVKIRDLFKSLKAKERPLVLIYLFRVSVGFLKVHFTADILMWILDFWRSVNDGRNLLKRECHLFLGLPRSVK